MRTAGGGGSKAAKAKSITDLAEQQGGTAAYVCRLLQLTYLAPDIVEAILDGRQPKSLRLAEMLGNVAFAGNAQRVEWSFGSSVTATHTKCSYRLSTRRHPPPPCTSMTARSKYAPPRQPLT